MEIITQAFQAHQKISKSSSLEVIRVERSSPRSLKESSGQVQLLCNLSFSIYFIQYFTLSTTLFSNIALLSSSPVLLLSIISELRCLFYSISIIVFLVFSPLVVSTCSIVWLGCFDLISLELGSKQQVYRLSVVLRLYLTYRYDQIPGQIVVVGRW